MALVLVAVIFIVGGFALKGRDNQPHVSDEAAIETGGAYPAMPQRLTSNSRVGLNGIGSIRIGMTVAEAQAVSSDPLPKTEHWPSSQNCYFRQLSNGPAGVYFMIQGERVVRVDITNEAIATKSGARIGDAEKRIGTLYSGQIETGEHKYDPNGHYLTFVPKDPKDRSLRLLFETDGRSVTTYRVGEEEAVYLVEHCM